MAWSNHLQDTKCCGNLGWWGPLPEGAGAGHWMDVPSSVASFYWV